MKRVALIRNSYSYNFGGGEIFAINTARILAGNDYEPLVLSANKKTLTTAKSAKLKTVFSPWWSFQNFSGTGLLLFPVYILWQIYLFAWYLLWGIKHKVDIFHPQSRDDFIAVTMVARLLRKKVIWTDHADLKHIYANHRVWYKNPVGKLVFLTSLLANNVTLESMSEKRLVEAALGKKLPKNYSVIHIGVVDTYKPIERSGNKLVLVATSRLVKDKGIGELIEAIKLVGGEGVVLKLCGDGPDADQFKKQAKDAKNIEFLGHVNDVTQVLGDADIFVHPTYHEGFGLSLVEAEMCSLPIIASDVGSIPEIVQNGVSGILVKPKGVEELAAAITKLVENKNLRLKMGQAGREIYLNNFQFDKIVEEKFIPLYEETTKN